MLIATGAMARRLPAGGGRASAGAPLRVGAGAGAGAGAVRVVSSRVPLLSH